MSLIGIFIVYAWEKVPNNAVLCDVGGSNSHMALDLLKNYPQFKVVIHDLPPVIEQAKEVNMLFNRNKIYGIYACLSVMGQGESERSSGTACAVCGVGLPQRDSGSQ